MTVDRFLDRLAAAPDGPWFAWVQIYEPHPPATPPEPFRSRAYSADPTDPARRHRDDWIGRIHAMECCVDLDAAEGALRRGHLPSRLRARLAATVAAMRNGHGGGPDLASHLAALGPAAWRGESRAAFLDWLARAIEPSADGRAPRALIDWLGDLRGRLGTLERDMLHWLDGIVDFNYLLKLYAAAVASADHAIGRIVEGLDRLGAAEPTWIVATAPHGEMLDEWPTIFHHQMPTEAALRVPLIVRPPAAHAMRRGATIDGVFDLVDLMPTLLAWLGVAPPAGLRGRDLSAEIEAGRRIEGISLATSMLGSFAAATKPPFKLVRARWPDEPWPFLEGPMPASGQILLRCDDEARDRAGEHPEIVAELERAIAPAVSNGRDA